MEKSNVGYDTLFVQAKEQGISPIEFIAKLDKDTYNNTVVGKNIRRFSEDINDEIRKKERVLEDLKDSVPGLLREMPATSDGRMQLVNAINLRMGQIKEIEESIDNLQDFEDTFLKAPVTE